MDTLQSPDSTDSRERSPSEPQQYYYRPVDACDEAQTLVERKDLTKQDVLNFVHGESARPISTNESDKWKSALLEAYHRRRHEISDLARKLWTGEAIVDDDGRLVPMGPVEAAPVPDPALRNGNDNNDNNHNNNNVDGNNNNNINAGILNWNIPINNNNLNQQPFPLDNEEEERRWLEQEERYAAEAIARAVKRYRQQGVPENEFVLIKVQPAARTERANLTFRRICFAVLAVVTAFICIMLQTLPLFPRNTITYPRFDKLLYELLHVRSFHDHVQACPDLHRSSAPSRRFWQIFPERSYYNAMDCSDGVLHIPSKTVLVDSFFESSTSEKVSVWGPYVSGVNVSWFMPCRTPTYVTVPGTCRSYPQGRVPIEACDAQEQTSEKARCFRGVHDNFISDQEVREALRVGAQLIQQGGDHFDIHYDIDILQERLPSVLEKIRKLLQGTYSVYGDLDPVAFRINAVAPMDGSGVPYHGTQSEASEYLLRILNKTKYVKWMAKCEQQNERARYSIPWSSRPKPFRDPCYLVADLQVDPSFAIHSTVFLSTGANWDFRGGVSLYVDDDKSNNNARKKIRKGVTIDGSRGRVVVSTGGLENRRCRLPVREGIRASLQIWWNCRG